MAEQELIKSLLEVVTEVKTPVGLAALGIVVICIIALVNPKLLGGEKASPLLRGLLGLCAILSLGSIAVYALETVKDKSLAQLYEDSVAVIDPQPGKPLPPTPAPAPAPAPVSATAPAPAPPPAPEPELCNMGQVSCFRVEGHGGLVFGLYRTGQNWLAQRDFIHSKGASLATVPDQEVNKAFVNALNTADISKAYIGLNDIDTEGHWMWDAGGALGQFRNWYPDQPDNKDPHPTGEDHVVLEKSGRWNDVMGGQFGFSLPAFFQIQSAYEAPYK